MYCRKRGTIIKEGNWTKQNSAVVLRFCRSWATIFFVIVLLQPESMLMNKQRLVRRESWMTSLVSPLLVCLWNKPHRLFFLTILWRRIIWEHSWKLWNLVENCVCVANRWCTFLKTLGKLVQWFVDWDKWVYISSSLETGWRLLCYFLSLLSPTMFKVFAATN